EPPRTRRRNCPILSKDDHGMSTNQSVDIHLLGTAPSFPPGQEALTGPVTLIHGGHGGEPVVAALASVTQQPAPAPPDAPPKQNPSSILVIDVGGTKIKILAAGQTEP